VIFFAVAITVQIAVIKLSGGFFYSREINNSLAAKTNDASQKYFFSRPAAAKEGYLRLQPPLFPNRGIFGGFFAFVPVFFQLFVVCLCSLILRINIFWSLIKFYRYGCIFVRPPTIFREPLQ
jgi:hypothetical protein